LQNLLQEDKYHETQTRLTNKGLPKGIAILLHGVPGTGKTEIVKQLAKTTNREIMKVEISQSKSMWFGESEKIIKRIFTDYRAYAKESKLTPILLFNEADAIISKRKENSNSGVAQTENAIQNIILEELENFEGILMATTNLANNMDAAFERRFLFKIPFKKPTKEVRAKIWKSKLPHLEAECCQILAEKFDFSGGQIDNIIRKSEIQEIVHGSVTNFEQIQSFCKEEFIITKTTKIGFSYAHD
ncbi:MAG: ATP-binding protein, partial [Bacteroidetes bacterium]|nr:ATP-binding protein [Bacteroidota bacterium]